MTRGLMMTALFRITAKWVHRPHIAANRSHLMEVLRDIHIMPKTLRTVRVKQHMHLQLTLTLSPKTSLKIQENISKTQYWETTANLQSAFSVYHILHLHFQKSVLMMLLLSCLSRKTIRLGFTVSKTVLQPYGSVGIRILPKQTLSAMFQWIRLTIILTVR